ncbi:MAG: PEGA domain-containing protein [Archangium sp.]
MLALTLSFVLTAAPAELTIDVKPAEVTVLVDGQKKSIKNGPITVKVKPGRHHVKLSFKGDTHQEEIALKAGEKKTYQWSFEHSGPSTLPTDEVAPGSEVSPE